ncbi:GAF domain-containing protein [Halalkalibacter nanhaiisediminis]|uniref:RsbT co-antagonist protein RsbR n=1 Tax=Halalkalibacter nanhaiisediminis TaxID=688079 RepID=A0A562QQU7_9BACI|nr:STAS domain-containing protein [Halalkalibacter nanhaiisediminis]TWI59119.1 rsbT co-antagonist protein RsbR [Halalkalibacter nanhaiisediminis]
MTKGTVEKSRIRLNKFENFDEAINEVLHLMNRFIDINTLFIAKNDTYTNEIIKVINQDYVLLEEGGTLPFRETFCKLSVEKGKEILVIPDITKSELTAHLEVTKKLGGGSFIGIPLYFGNGENYGTICGLDNKPFEFIDKHLELFETMSSLLTYILELDIANKQIKNLVAPIVPVAKGIAILPIIGDISEELAESITLTALSESQRLSLDYLIFDLSGVQAMNRSFTSHLLKKANSLNLIGVTPVMTGIKPNLAMKAVEFKDDLQGIKTHATLEQALVNIGFSLKRT